MAKTIDRRSFLQFNKSSIKQVTHIDPQWPTPEMARLHRNDSELEPFIFQLDPPNNPPRKINATSSLYKLSDNSWNRETATHLLNRIHPGTTFSDIKKYNDLGLNAAISEMLKIRPKPDKPSDWVEETIPNFKDMTASQQKEYQILYRKRRVMLVDWWMNLIMKDEVSIRENMTLFWHEHFATNAQKVYFPQAVYEQNDVIRENCLGNFRTLLRKVTFGPAMMIWLDSRRSKKKAPNENFPRELLELFTMGVDTYSQDDIVAASQAFTGYNTDGYITNYHFEARRADGEYWQKHHDFNHKEFLGKQGYFDGDDIIDIIMEQDAVANFICGKIYKWFVYEIPDENFVNQMATILRDSNYEIKPVMEYLLTSEHFYDINFRGSQILNPVSQILGLIRKLNLHNMEYPNKYLQRSIGDMGMTLLYPPDVNGWTGHRAWINSITLPMRKRLSSILIDPDTDKKLEFHINIIELANNLSDPNDARSLVKDFALILFGLPLSENLENKLVEILMDGATEYDWDINASGADYRLKELVKYMLRLPEAQLA